MKRFVNSNGEVAHEYVADGDTLHHRMHSVGRDKIMHRLAEMRKSPDAVKTTDWGKLECEIPLQDIPMLAKFFPGLDAGVGTGEYKFALNCFLKSPVSAPYRYTAQRKRGGL